MQDERRAALLASRPQLDTAVLVARPGDELVFSRLDRLDRSLKDLIRLVADLQACEGDQPGHRHFIGGGAHVLTHPEFSPSVTMPKHARSLSMHSKVSCRPSVKWAVVAALLLLLIGCSSPEPDVVETSPEPTPTSQSDVDPSESTDSPDPLINGEEAVCLEGFPALESAADIILALADNPDGSTIDQGELRETVSRLEHLMEVAPTDMVPLLREQAAPLQTLRRIYETGENENIDLQNFRSSGYELATRCRPHANGSRRE